jgi:hypothetical protein
VCYYFETECLHELFLQLWNIHRLVLIVFFPTHLPSLPDFPVLDSNFINFILNRIKSQSSSISISPSQRLLTLGMTILSRGCSYRCSDDPPGMLRLAKWLLNNLASVLYM